MFNKRCFRFFILLFFFPLFFSLKAEEGRINLGSTEISPSVKMSKKPETDIPRDYEWMSDRLSFEGKGMAYSDLDRDGNFELLVIDLTHVYIYQVSPEKRLNLFAVYTGKPSDNFMRVYAIDLNGDQKLEIVVSNIRKGQAASLVLEYDQGKFHPLVTNSPWILKVLQGKEGPLLLGEPFGGREVDFHNIKRLKLIGDKLEEEGAFEVPQGVGIYGLKEFYFNQSDPPGLIYLTPSGSLKVYRKEGSKFKKETSSSEKYGGTSNFIRATQKNILNEVVDEFTYIHLDPVTWVEKNGKGAVIVAKNDNFLKNIIGTKPLVKSSSFAKLRWEQIGLREAWNTRKIEGHLVDYQIVQLPWENSPKLLALLWLRDSGFSSTITGKFPSVVAVYDLE